MLSVVTCCTMAADPFPLTANVPSSPPAMASDVADKINRLTLARTNLEKWLDINHECILEAIERKDRTALLKSKNGFKVVKNAREKPSPKMKKSFFYIIKIQQSSLGTVVRDFNTQKR